MPFIRKSIARPILGVILTACIGNRPATAAAATTRPVTAQKVSIEAEDGVLVIGDYYPPAPKAGETAPIAVLLHMERSNRSAWKPLVPHLHAMGFAVLAIDLRGHGESVEPRGFNLATKAANRDSRLFRAMYKDVAAAYLWLVRQGRVDATRFVLVGAGIGCSVALDYASRDRSVDAIACLTPGLNYPGLDSTAAIRKCDARAILLTAAKADADAVNELQRACGKATVKIVSDLANAGRTKPDDAKDQGDGEGGSAAIRGTEMLGKAKDLERTIAAFLDHAAGRSTTDPVVASTNSDIYHVPGTSHAQRIKDENRRWFSSATEAETRGLRPVKKRATKSSGEARQASPKPANPRLRTQH